MAYTTINKSSDYFNTKLYTGNGSTQSITGVGFQPDLVWIKSRSLANGHTVWDNIRGVTNWLTPNNTNAEDTYSGGLTSFDSDGFSIGDGGDINTNSATQVSWNWLASNTTASNTDGSITSTVSANTTSGFSIVKYTGNATAGATIGHGLGAVPSFIVVKRIDGVSPWHTYHASLGNTQRMSLNETDATDSDSTAWNNTTPTSSVFTVGNSGTTNVNNADTLAYCFAEKKGFSKFGSYVGNGNADGTFVYTGFKPAFVMVKRSSNIESWQITDHARDANVSPNFARLIANSSGAEATNTTWAKIEKFSNGFKLGGTDTVSNGSGSTYIYMAFAESPLVGTNNIPATAR